MLLFFLEGFFTVFADSSTVSGSGSVGSSGASAFSISGCTGFSGASAFSVSGCMGSLVSSTAFGCVGSAGTSTVSGCTGSLISSTGSGCAGCGCSVTSSAAVTAVSVSCSSSVRRFCSAAGFFPHKRLRMIRTGTPCAFQYTMRLVKPLSLVTIK